MRQIFKEVFPLEQFIDFLKLFCTFENNCYKLTKVTFKKYKFKVITCEHNFTSNREKIFNLLTDKGYVRKYSDVSKFDDWFVLEEMI